MKTLDQKLNTFAPARRRTIAARAAALIAEEQSLRQLRRARKLTQQRLARRLRIGQDGVSRLEQRSDLLLSTLRSYVQALGGHLSLIAEFPDGPPVRLAGFAGVTASEPARKTRHA
jgi:transcriptional regulator with XRE-family HTH domain